MTERNYSDIVPPTTVATAINASSTSLVLSLSLAAYITPPFELRLDPNSNSEEVVLVTAGAGTVGSPYTITRGYGTTTAKSHLGQARVEHCVSSADFSEFRDIGKVAVADKIIYCSTNGSDTNDGLSWKTAKLTLTAAAAALSGPGTIMLGKGTISTGGTVDLSSRVGVSIVGMGSTSAGATPATLVTHSAADASAAINLGHSSGCRVSGFYLLASNAAYTGALLDLHTTSGAATTLWAIRDMVVDGGTGGGGTGISLSWTQDGSITDCNIIRNNVGIAGRVDATAQTNVVAVRSCRFGSNVTAHVTNIGEAWEFSNCNFEALSAGGPGSIINTAGVTVKGVAITGCWFGDVTTTTGAGKQISLGGSGFLIAGNMIGVNTSHTCVEIQASSSGFRITDNYMVGSGTTDTGISLLGSGGTACTNYDCSNNTYGALATKITGGPTAMWQPATDATLAFAWRSVGGVADLAINSNSSRVGVQTEAPGSTLHVNGSFAVAYVAKTSAYTLTGSDSVVSGDTTGGAFSLTLPSSAGIAGRMYTIKRVNAGANNLTVATTSSQTIDGAATYVLSAQWKYVKVISDSANWLIVANN